MFFANLEQKRHPIKDRKSLQSERSSTFKGRTDHADAAVIRCNMEDWSRVMSSDDPERSVSEEEADALASSVQTLGEFVRSHGSEGHVPLGSGFRVGRRLLEKDLPLARKVSRVGWHTDFFLHQESSRDLSRFDRAEVSGDFFHFSVFLWDLGRTEFC